MKKLYDLYRHTILTYPKSILAVFALILLISALRIDQFRLDASAESLVLENDLALKNFRETSERFASSDDFLVVTYAPYSELFSDEGFAGLRSLRDDLLSIDGVHNTQSILNVPLLYSPALTLDTFDSEIKTIEADKVDPQTARTALLNSPLYPNLLISKDAKTTAIQVIPRQSSRYLELSKERSATKALITSGSKVDMATREKLEHLDNEFTVLSDDLNAKREALIADVRLVLDRHRDKAEIYLGGVPMIVVDMIRFIRSDISVFGIGVLVFLLLTLSAIFRQWRWVMVPLLCCSFTVWLVSGYLAWTNWPVTVISSNFISLLLIMTLSLSIHLMVRYREFQKNSPQDAPKNHLGKTIDAMIKPCCFMVITTIVAFCSFTLSDILPVIDFGWMMTIGLLVAFIITFVVFPAILLLFPPPVDKRQYADKQPLTLILAVFTEKHKTMVLVFSVTLAILSVIGVGRLTVENSFIDYFKKDTEIYQGMLSIDNNLGGTTPLDVIITGNWSPNGEGIASECDPFLDDCGEEQPSQNSWFTYDNAEKLAQVQDYLEGLKETGKVISLATTFSVIRQVNQGKELTDIELAFIPKLLTDDLKAILLSPYVSEETRQTRFTIRLIDSMPGIRRQQLLEDIRNHLVNEFGFSQEQVLLTGMTVLYNNMLQSLFDSQIKTLGVVFFAIMIMFLILFRSLSVALIGIAPNFLAASSLLGLMGWLNIPLDLMTITVAAISVGIAVDDTIHYIHRFKQEIAVDGDYMAAMHRCHGTIGKAMLYTSLTIVIGFSILVLSNFIPTIYFGLFTGFAMLMALLAALTLLPALIVIIKPFGYKKTESAQS